LLSLSRRAVQAAWSSQALAEQSLEARLGTLPRKTPLAVGPATSLADALARCTSNASVRCWWSTRPARRRAS